MPKVPQPHENNSDPRGRPYYKKATAKLLEVKQFLKDHSTIETMKKFFKPGDPDAVLVSRKDIANYKAQDNREKRGGHPARNVVDELQIIQSQLQDRDYLQRFVQRKHYAPCIILGKDMHLV